MKRKPTVLRLLAASAAFLIATANGQQLTTLVSFNGTNGEGPVAGLAQGSDGNFYGTTVSGGAYKAYDYSKGCGTVFRLSPNGTLTTLVSFRYDIGAAPYCGLVQDSDGNFYGTTAGGGAYGSPSGYGTVFKMTRYGTLTSLVSFNDSNGSSPRAGLVQGNDGNFYGTTFLGGASGSGTLFSVTPNGMLTTFFSFGGNKGSCPNAGLVKDYGGKFCGTTTRGGVFSGGTIFMFQVTPQNILTMLGSFNGGSPDAGANPDAPLLQKGIGSFYGTTLGGGPYGKGTVFHVTTSGALSMLISFNGTNGARPRAGLVACGSGFVGTTEMGGEHNVGTVFYVTSGGTLTTLVSFESGAYNSTGFTNGNGAYPYAALLKASDGDFYGTTSSGGAFGGGTVFKLDLRPYLAVQPLSQTSSVGATATFTVSATGLNPLRYQWQKNGTNLLDGGNIFGSTTNLLTLTRIVANDAGSYSVTIKNDFGSVVSSNAWLTVNVPPGLGLQFREGYPLLNLTGMLGNNFLIQYSTNVLGSSWTSLLSVSNLPGSPYQFLDLAGAGKPARFYRVVQVP